MYSHQWLYDKVLLVHLFQKSLEGEALRWFSSLPAIDLLNFYIVSVRFLAHFGHTSLIAPTLFDLVMEKMKPDEDFIHFPNRWRIMASKTEVPIHESQAITMLVNNSTPQLRAILMLSKLHTFPQLYNRARIV